MRLKQVCFIVVALFFLPLMSFAQNANTLVDWKSLRSFTNGDSPIVQEGDKVVLLDFWASWCGPCRQSFPWMNAMKVKYGDKGLRIVAVNLDSDKAEAMAFLSEVTAEFAVLFDQEGQSAEMLSVEAMPMSYLIKTNGEVISRMAGFNTPKQAVHEQHIRQSLELNESE